MNEMGGAVLRMPSRKMLSTSLLLALLTGAGFWSLQAIWVTFAALLSLYALRPLRAIFILGWSGLWGLFWYEFSAAFFRNMTADFGWGGWCAGGFGVIAGLLVFGMRWDEEYMRNEELGAGENQKQAPNRAPPRQQPAPPEGSAALDPYAVLHVARGASKAEIKAAYRREMALYHPDKVQHLGTTLQELAHQKTIEIQQAFQLLDAASIWDCTHRDRTACDPALVPRWRRDRNSKSPAR
jgi:hypothetical protein